MADFEDPMAGFGHVDDREPVFPDPFTYTWAAPVPAYWGTLPHTTCVCTKPLDELFQALKAAMRKFNITYTPCPHLATGFCCTVVHEYSMIEFDINIFAHSVDQVVVPDTHSVSFRHMRGSRYAVSSFLYLTLCPELDLPLEGHPLSNKPPPMPEAVEVSTETEMISVDFMVDLLKSDQQMVTQALSIFWATYADKTHFYVEDGIGLPMAFQVAELFLGDYDVEVRILCMGAISELMKIPNLCQTLRETLLHVAEKGKQDSNFHVRHFAELCNKI
jgi:hypothetical protein